MAIKELGCTLDNRFGAIAAKAMEDETRTRVLPMGIVKAMLCAGILIALFVPTLFASSLLFEDPRYFRALPVFSTLLVLSLPMGLILVRARVRFLKYWAIALVLFLLTIAGNVLCF